MKWKRKLYEYVIKNIEILVRWIGEINFYFGLGE